MDLNNYINDNSSSKVLSNSCNKNNTNKTSGLVRVTKDNLVPCDLCRNRVSWANGMKYDCLHFFCEKCIFHSILTFIGEQNAIGNFNPEALGNGKFRCFSCDKGLSPFSLNNYLAKSAYKSSNSEEYKASSYNCESCQKTKAKFYCKDCNLLLCSNCTLYVHNLIKTFNSHDKRDLNDTFKAVCFNCKRKQISFSCCNNYYCLYCFIMFHHNHNYKYLKKGDNYKKTKTEKYLYPLAKQSRNHINGTLSSSSKPVIIDECDPPTFIEKISDELLKLEEMCKPRKGLSKVLINNELKHSLDNSYTKTKLLSKLSKSTINRKTIFNNKITSSKINDAYTIKSKDNKDINSTILNINKTTKHKIDHLYRKITNYLKDEKQYYLLSYNDKSGSFKYLQNLISLIKKIREHIIVAKNLSPDQIKDGSNDILVRIENKEDQIIKLLTNDIQLFKSMVDNRKSVGIIYNNIYNINKNSNTLKVNDNVYLSENLNNNIKNIELPNNINTCNQYKNSISILRDYNNETNNNSLDVFNLKCYPIIKFNNLFCSSSQLSILSTKCCNDYLLWTNGFNIDIMELPYYFYDIFDNSNNIDINNISLKFIKKNNIDNQNINNINSTSTHKTKNQIIESNSKSTVVENRIKKLKCINIKPKNKLYNNRIFNNKSYNSNFADSNINKISNCNLPKKINIENYPCILNKLNCNDINTNSAKILNYLKNLNEINCKVSRNENKDSLKVSKSLNLRNKTISFNLNVSLNSKLNNNIDSFLKKSNTLFKSKNLNILKSSRNDLNSNKNLFNETFSFNTKLNKYSKKIGYAINEDYLINQTFRHTLRKHKDTINYIKCFRYIDEDYILICSSDYCISIWRGKDFYYLCSYNHGYKCFCCEATVSSKSLYIITASFKKTEPIKIFQGIKLKYYKTLPIKGFAFCLKMLNNCMNVFDKRTESLLCISILDGLYKLLIYNYKSNKTVLSIQTTNYCSSYYLINNFDYSVLSNNTFKLDKDNTRYSKSSKKSCSNINENKSMSKSSLNSKEEINTSISLNISNKFTDIFISKINYIEILKSCILYILDKNGVFKKIDSKSKKTIKERNDLSKKGYFAVIENMYIISIKNNNQIVILDMDLDNLILYNTQPINYLVKHSLNNYGTVFIAEINNYGIVIIK